MSDNKRYSDQELAEFKVILQQKLAIAKEELDYLIKQIKEENPNGTSDTESTYLSIDDGTASLRKESTSILAARQQKFIDNLDAALVRIENKTYGICKVTGKLISKERLKAVPHTTQSIEAKKNQYR